MIDFYVFGGNSGTGKTTAGQKVADHLGVKLLDMDLMRREMGIRTYSRDDSPRVMAQILQEKINAHALGKPVVLCSPFVRASAREQLYSIHNEHSQWVSRPLSMLFIECVCSEMIAKVRIAARDTSDVLHQPSNNPAVWDRIHNESVPISELEMHNQKNTSYLRYNSEEGVLSIQKIGVLEHEDLKSLEVILRSNNTIE